jgi:hypothetical protein
VLQLIHLPWVPLPLYLPVVILVVPLRQFLLSLLQPM